MSQEKFKDFGLKFIEEMANERAHSKQEVSIDILNLKNSQFKPARQFSLEELEAFVESTREHVIRVFDGEFTKLTIKSLSKMRQLLTGSTDSSIMFDESEVPKAELTKALGEVSVLTDELERIKSERAKEKAELELEIEKITQSKRELEDKITESDINEKKLYAQIQSMDEQLVSSKVQVTNLTKDLMIKNETLKQLIEQHKLTEDDLQLITENMDTILFSEEEHHKQEIQDAIQRTRNELAFEYELNISNLNNKIEKEKELVEESENKFKKLESQHQEFVEKTLQVKKDYAELKFRLERGHKTLNFIQSLLSTHPLYSAVMILSDLGGEMPLDTLAKSVGAAPIRLRQLLSELAERGLLEIGEGENPLITIVDDY